MVILAMSGSSSANSVAGDVSKRDIGESPPEINPVVTVVSQRLEARRSAV
jgi:hypothetical protein